MRVTQSAEEQRQSDAVLAALQQLPEGVRALPPAAAQLASPERAGARPGCGGIVRGTQHAGVPRCDICSSEEETNENLLLQCDCCHVYVRRPPAGSPCWLMT